MKAFTVSVWVTATAWLARGARVLGNRKWVQRRPALYPRKKLSQPGAGHRVYLYALRDVAITRPNQLWAAYVCNILMAKEFVYLVAIMDLTSPWVLAWRRSNTLDSHFCVEALEEALARYGPPEIFNTDQGTQFTSSAFTSILKEAGEVISMNGKERWGDNMFVERLWRSVKYGEVYLKAYALP